jgi:glycerophosphoryl diester phosphodiesterase
VSTPVEIIAHRGASHDAPENTLAAVNLAWEQGADAVEIDVQASSDHRIVVIHDPTTKKTAGVNRKVCEQTFASLCQLDAGLWKSPKFRGERIPPLADVLRTVPSGKRLFIEIKCGENGLPDLMDTIRQSHCIASQIVLIGFCIDTMARAKTMRSGFEVGWVVKSRRNWKTGRWTPTITNLIEEAKARRLDALDLGAKRPLTRAHVDEIKAAGLKVYIWTVDSPSKAKHLISAGVNGITTNRPGWLREQLAPVGVPSNNSAI